MIQKLIFFIILSLFNISAFADENLDQWYDTDKTYFYLIQEGFEVKGYNSSTINDSIIINNIIILYII